ncbi:MAG: hypothetical protein M3525_08185 [Acidobacteriota bacterium]|nr:hypothetical protein [Acidobacteriota bacterium]
MEKIENQKLAERIALLLREAEKGNDDFLRSSIKKINERLDDIESNIAFQNPKFKTQNLKSNHPSREKFEIPEAISIETNQNYEIEKFCPYEPTGKLCDHCSMCNSLGF